MESKIICGDALEEVKKLPNNSISAIIIDPPFGIGFKYTNKEQNDNSEDYWKWLEPIYNECLRTLKDGGFVAIWQTQLYFKHFWNWFGNNIHIYAGCKNFVQLRKTPINYAYDPIIMFYKNGKELRPLKPKRNVDFFVANTAKWVTQTNDLARKHPCPRPIDQVREIINNFVIEEGIVLDCFFGSGTTGVICEETGRKYIGIDNNEEYCVLAEQRIKKCQIDKLNETENKQ